MTGGGALGRRSLILGASVTLISRSAFTQTRIEPDAISDLANIEARLGGRLGIAVLDTGSGKRLSYRGDERFAMCSTFKLLLVAAVLGRVGDGRLSLDRRIPYSTADLLEYAPFSREHLAEGSLPVADLCGAALEISDNTAANLLLGLIGGPTGLTDYLRGLGDSVTRLDRNEPDLNSNIPGDVRDTTNPDAMIKTMSKIIVGDALASSESGRLIGWMQSCRTGLARLRSGLPLDWTAGDKTGSGNNGASNDVAILWPAGRGPILVAAYLSGSSSSAASLDAAHAKLGGVIAAEFA
jgi:beta-lactamase class A